MKMTSSAVMKALFSKSSLCLFSLATLFGSFPAFAMVEMKDEQLADVTGQALMQMGKEFGTGLSSDVAFYKAGLDVAVEMNLNIEKLQLGCTDNQINGQNCDVDIRNFSLSGLPSNYINNSSDPNFGSPDFATDGGRVATSALLSQPFFEFAVKNDESKTLREVVGVRLGANDMEGLLTAGTVNRAAPSVSDGIQSLSGFMRIKNTTGEVRTQQSVFGLQADEEISGLIRVNTIWNNDREFTSMHDHADTVGITVPSMTAGFSVPSFQVNGKRNTMASVENVTTSINEIPLSLEGCQAAGGINCQNLLRVELSSGILGVESTKVRLKEGSRINNLNLDVTFNQSLSMIHNIPLTGTGFYLSMQGEDVRWPGSHQDDIARQGWWMSFANEVDLGYLQGSNPVDISSVFPQVASLMTNELMKEENRIYVGIGGAIGALFNQTVVPPNAVAVDLDNATNPGLGGNPASITLSNVQLTNQQVTPNCWGSASFC